MKAAIAAGVILAITLVVHSLDRLWEEQWRGLKAAPQGEEFHGSPEVTAPAPVGAAPKLSMPCTWISMTGANEPLRPRCVKADFSDR